MPAQNMIKIITFICLAAGPGIADAKPAAWEGKVVSVADGDTITVLRGKEQVRIRLDGVDTPEKRQAFGQKAKKFTAGMVAGKVVKVVPVTLDRYGRTVARVYLGKASLNEALVRAGFAWWYRKYAKDNKVLPKLEAAARKAGKGLWKDPKPTPPWDWRHQQRGKAPVAAPPPSVGHPSGSFHGNAGSKVLHAPGCQHYNCKRCTARFKTVEQARATGYRPHKDCVH